LEYSNFTDWLFVLIPNAVETEAMIKESYSEAIEWFRKALLIQTKKLGQNQPDLIATKKAMKVCQQKVEA